MTKLRDKMNVLEQWLTTLTGTCTPPHRFPSSSEDLPPSPPPAPIH